ncbi:MAG: hypothetical protein OXC91_11830 [Rhodobacteraceae bacterium]|nr:hypothetical protein [Paracoccaceae bacterium]
MALENTNTDAIIEPAVHESLADKLHRPLQISEHLDRTCADVHRTGADKMTCDIVEGIISTGFDDLSADLAQIRPAFGTVTNNMSRNQAMSANRSPYDCILLHRWQSNVGSFPTGGVIEAAGYNN